MQKNEKIFYSLLENFVLIVILLVIIQTFLEDFSIYMGWSIDIINRIKLTAFFFDLFFTFEFFIRFVNALIKRKGRVGLRTDRRN